MVTGGSIGGALCLDFANSPGNLLNGPDGGYDALAEWCLAAGIGTRERVTTLAGAARRQPSAADGVVRRARALRAAIVGTFSASVRGEAPAPGDLDVLNRELAAAMTHARVVRAADGFDWCWAGADAAPDWMLWPIARSAADLLTSDDVRLVKECASGTCAWLFVDTTKNHRRRWCDMKVCGNRAKVREYRRRQRAT